jgi:NADPH:quinone reductase-like Zn-dependent oxidoreductase
MKAFIIDRYGKKGPMRLGDMPEPEVRDDDVLIEVHAAGLNRWIPRSKAASSN